METVKIFCYLLPANVTRKALLVPNTSLVGCDLLQIENFSETFFARRFNVAVVDSKFRRIDERRRTEILRRLFVNPLTAEHPAVSGSPEFSAMTTLIV